MAEWIAIGTGGPETVPNGVLERLRAVPARFHVAPAHPSFEWLASLGIPCQPLAQGAMPGDGLIVVPIDPELGAKPPSRGEAIERLVTVVDRLLGPGGCPWDQEQTHESLKRYLLEESYELFEAIDSHDESKLIEELGDVLLQPIMHIQMEDRDGKFGIEHVVNGITEKLIRRHPHVFGDAEASTADEVLRNWDRIKRDEGKEAPKSVLGGIPRSMPSLARALEVSKRAVRVGFEWPDLDGVMAKLDEERQELAEAIQSGDAKHIEAELGDLLFTVVNIARWAKVDPEEALRRMLTRFTDRFMAMESLAQKPLQELSFEEWDELWIQAKAMQSSGDS